MKKIFILGASRLQIPAIRKAKEKGMYVYVLDYDPKAAGISEADEYLCISTIDNEAVYEAALKYKPDFIITSTSDMPVRTVSWVNERLGKHTDISYEGAACATNKAAMRKRMEECNVPIPEYHIINSEEEFIVAAEKMPRKFVVKPVDNAASRGVLFIDKSNEYSLHKVYQYSRGYSREGVVLIEEFMEGPEVSVESYTVGGVPHIISITDKMVSELPYFVELGHTEPSRLTEKEQADIRNVAKAAIKAIGMQDGPNHTEIKVTATGAKLVEIAARLGGDYITSKLVPLSTGVDMIECSFATLLNEKVLYNKKYSRGAAIRFIQGENGILDEIKGIEKAKTMPGIVEVEIYKEVGEQIRKPENSNDRIGHVIAVGKNSDEAAMFADEALKVVNICVK